MADYVLVFGVDGAPSYKVVKFTSAEHKNNYVNAEFKDRACQKAYFAYQSAKTKDERAAAAETLSVTRYAFYKRYMLDVLQESQFAKANLRLVDDDPGLNFDPDPDIPA